MTENSGASRTYQSLESMFLNIGSTSGRHRLYLSLVNDLGGEPPEFQKKKPFLVFNWSVDLLVCCFGGLRVWPGCIRRALFEGRRGRVLWDGVWGISYLYSCKALSFWIVGDVPLLASIPRARTVRRHARTHTCTRVRARTHTYTQTHTHTPVARMTHSNRHTSSRGTQAAEEMMKGRRGTGNP